MILDRITLLIFITFICLACVNSDLQQSATPKRPNFIIFLVDDLGWMDVGFMGSKYYETPNIDRMASEGMIFSNAYANAPNCAPSRACLLTGLYTPRHGIYTVGNPDRGKSENRLLIAHSNKVELDSSFVTIAEALHSLDYKTIHLGKWHMGKSSSTLPNAQGFDINIGGNERGGPNSYFSPYHNPNLSDGPEGEYLTDRLTEEAIGFIDSNQDSPFFMYFSHYGVHTPIQAKEDLIDSFRSKQTHDGQDNPTYAAMVKSVDESLGKIMLKLDELELSEETMILFFSDNGGYGGVTTHGPLKGSKGMMYEGGFREPLIAWWPDRIEANSTSDEVVMGMDFFPTLVDLAGGKSKDYKLDGQSLVSVLLNGDTLDREAVYWHFPAYLQSYKSIKNPEDLTRGWRAVPSAVVRKGTWKLIEDFETGELQLFNLDSDISEEQNLAESNPLKTKELHDDLKLWRRQVNAPVPSQKNPEYDSQND